MAILARYRDPFSKRQCVHFTLLPELWQKAIPEIETLAGAIEQQ
ncbi:MAG: hypothetical protein WAL95_14780 [Candidatus Acidiferrales bacterium]